MRLDELASQRQAEAERRLAPHPALLDPVEAVEDSWQIGGGDAHAIVADLDYRALLVAARTEANLTAAVDNAQARATEKAQKLESQISASTGFVFGDARRLRESIEHVLNNALAYTDRKGRIAIRAEGDEERATIEISDNGSGISDEDVPRVFNRFDRVFEAGIRGEAALGLGLPLTRQFVEAHGGTVELKSKKGEGTIVTLTIPRGQK